jgi:hypothetical protein
MWVFPCRHITHQSFPFDRDERGVSVAVLRLKRPLRRLIDLVQGMTWHML